MWQNSQQLDQLVVYKLQGYKEAASFPRGRQRGMLERMKRF